MRGLADGRDRLCSLLRLNPSPYPYRQQLLSTTQLPIQEYAVRAHPLPSAQETAALPPDGGPDYNRLIFQSSPYLLLHATNPVDWYPWGPEALQRARDEDKPIFLSIGYASCHWCHVRARESFADEEVARLLNGSYVAIKVDKEECPDLVEDSGRGDRGPGDGGRRSAGGAVRAGRLLPDPPGLPNAGAGAGGGGGDVVDGAGRGGEGAARADGGERGLATTGRCASLAKAPPFGPGTAPEA